MDSWDWCRATCNSCSCCTIREAICKDHVSTLVPAKLAHHSPTALWGEGKVRHMLFSQPTVFTAHDGWDKL